MTRFAVHNRFTGAVQFTAEIDCAEDAPRSVKLGLAFKWALENVANLRRANLAGAELRGAKSRGADLRVADLRVADLRGADLRVADLRVADLRGATWVNGVKIMRQPIIVEGLKYSVIILDAHAQVGCKLRSLYEWEAMTEDDADRIELGAFGFWRQWRDPLLAMARANGRDFSQQGDPA